MVKNIAIQFLMDRKEDLVSYSGLCSDLADEICTWIGEDRVQLLFLKPKEGSSIVYTPNHFGKLYDNFSCDIEDCDWDYHIVPVIDGIVHDAWHPELVLQPDEYIKEAFPGQDIHGVFDSGQRIGIALDMHRRGLV